MYEVKKVFAQVEGAIIAPNVRDAVEGLDIDSDLVGPVEFYGDRFSIMPAKAVLLKAPRNTFENRLLEAHRRFLLAQGVGPTEVHYIPSANNHSDGIVARLLALEPGELQGHISGCPLMFFMDTMDGDRVVSLAKTGKMGAEASLARRLNCKALQRRLVADAPGRIFPRHSIVSNVADMGPAYESLSDGEIVVKVPHLASGEGMVVVDSLEKATKFFQDWQPTLAHHGFPPDIIVEQKMPLAKGNSSTSVQFFRQGERLYFLGCSAQHMGADGFVHEGNMAGAAIHSRIPAWVESEMLRLSSLVLDNLPEFQGFIGFDFIVTSSTQVLLTEINLRITASTILYALMAQLGEHLSYDLRKIHVGPQPKLPVEELFQVLSIFNKQTRKVLPLNPRLFDETGDMFLAICAPTFEEIDDARNEVLSWF